MAHDRSPHERRDDIPGGRPDTMATLQRMLIIIRKILTRGFVTRKSIAEELRISERTVRRYLNTLDSAGFKLREDVNGNYTGTLQLQKDWQNKNPQTLLALEEKELMRLYLMLSGISHLGTQKEKNDLWEKIRNGLSQEKVNQKSIQTMTNQFDKGFKGYEDEQVKKVITDLLLHMYNQKRIQVTYRRPDGKENSFGVEPYQLFEFDGGVYVFCHLPYATDGNNRILILAVERIKAVKDQKEEFEKQADVVKEIEEKKKRAFRIFDDEEEISVKLRFDKEVAYYAGERTWHNTQKTTWDKKDGSLTLQFKASGKIEILRWIRSWGPYCQVLAPKSLKEEVKKDLEKALALY